MPTLVSLARAKQHLQVVGTDHNDAVLAAIDYASAVVVDYLGTAADEAWTETTAPAVVQIATLLFVAHFYEHRGDDMSTDGPLWLAVERLLMRLRPQALA